MAKLTDETARDYLRTKDKALGKDALRWQTGEPPESVELLFQYRNVNGLHVAIGHYEPAHARANSNRPTDAFFYESSGGRMHAPETVEHWIRLWEVVAAISK